jgi:hypothetical protein
MDWDQTHTSTPARLHEWRYASDYQPQNFALKKRTLYPRRGDDVKWAGSTPSLR